MLILGINPGANTGVAHFLDGELARLETIAPHQIERTLREAMPARVVFEDSRLQSHTWTRGKSGAASAKMARNVGQVDAWCTLITSICGELGIPAHGISPAGKGSKLQAHRFAIITGWTGSTNEHTRDAAMVAWPFRRAADPRGGTVPEITLVRQDAAPIAPQDAEAARRVFFGIVDGLGERGRKQWRRLWNGLMRLQPGEMVEITTVQPRLGWYHRKHMAMEQAVFEAQERFEDFESFRTWLKVGASFVDWYPGPKGGVIPVPRSISYSKLEQGAMEQFHNDAVAFLRTEHAGKTLWKHLGDCQRIQMIETILGGFNE